MIVLVNGQEEPYAWGTVDIDDAIGQRSTASFTVVDQDGNKRFKKGQNVEIYDYDRKDTLSRADFAGKISGSVTENPHIAKRATATSLVAPSSSSFIEFPQSDGGAPNGWNYDNLMKSDSNLTFTNAPTNGAIAQQLFSFNIIEHIKRNYGFTPSLDWVKNNVKQVVAYWYGKGSGPAGNKATFKVYRNTDGQYFNGSPTPSHTNNTITGLSANTLYVTYFPSMVDNNGFVHFLAFADASDGVTASKIETDYINLEVTLKADYALPPEKLAFGGVISRPVARYASLAGRQLMHGITCADWHYFADKRIIAKAYENTDAGDIARDIITNYLAAEGITVGNIQTGPTIVQAVFNYVPISQAFDSLCEKAAFEWFIDADKQLHFFERSTFYAPTDITETSDIKNVDVEPAAEDYRNKQYIRAGKDITDPQNADFAGDGTTKTFTLPYELALEPDVYLNGVAQTVGIRGLEEGQQWYWNKGDKVLTQDDAGTPITANDTLHVVYQGYYDIVALSYDQTAIDLAKNIEGGTGLHEDVLDDPYITSREAAFESASAKLRRYAKIGNRVTFDTKITGFRAGQLVNIDLPGIGVDDTDFLIESIKAAELGTADGRLIYTISAVDGAASGGWANFFKKMATRGQAFVIRENIQENELLIILEQFNRTWAANENPGPFFELYPSANLYPGATLYPAFNGPEHRVKFISFFDANNVEFYRLAVTKQNEDQAGRLVSTFVIPAYAANDKDIAYVGFWGGSTAKQALGSGILLDKQPYVKNKSDLEMIQIEKTDVKGW